MSAEIWYYNKRQVNLALEHSYDSNLKLMVVGNTERTNTLQL